MILKSDIVRLVEKKNAKEVNRGYLLYRGKDPVSPYIVCSNYTVNDTTNEVDWDWGHYCNNIFTALVELYRYEIEDAEIFERKELDWLDWYIKECSIVQRVNVKITPEQYELLGNLTTIINCWLKRDNTSIKL